MMSSLSNLRGESSSRILVDRSTIRLDGHPFFSFGPRVLLTPQDQFPTVLSNIVQAGFTLVGSPPCSPGTIPLIDAFFDAAEEVGLMVMLIADPRLPEHGRYLADHFRHRTTLHSYLLAPRPADEKGYLSYIRERDNLRARDLFHPISLPLTSNHLSGKWLQAQDIFCPHSHSTPNSHPTRQNQRLAPAIKEVYTHSEGLAARPVIITDLNVLSSDRVRETGVYNEDPSVATFPPKSLDWFPWYATFPGDKRGDLFDPPPELLRLQIYDLLTEGGRGCLLNFYEALRGTPPFTGRDRFCEAALLAKEMAVFQDFFADGRPDPITMETGHPRLKASVFRHGYEQLIILRMEGYEEDFFVDEGYMERTELEIVSPPEGPIHAWRLDFPEAQQLEIIKESSGAIRFLAGPLELTGLVLLTPGIRRSNELAARIRRLLPETTRLAIELAEVRLSKIDYIERKLRKLETGIDNKERLAYIQKGLTEARTMAVENDFVNAYKKAREMGRLCRQIIKYQMARALATPIFAKGDKRAIYRNSYFTLPRFYREGALETARAFSDLT
jgi:hypothetical protein